MNNDEKSDVEVENKESNNKTKTHTQSFHKQLFLIAITVFFGMFSYEFLKTYFLPTLSIWASHLITIVFSTVIATLAAYLILKSRNNLLEEITNSEMKYRKIFDNVQDVLYQTNMDGNITEISPSIERYSGYKQEELIGKPVEMVYSNPEDRNYLLKEIGEKGEVVDYEIELKTKNQDIVYSSINAHFLLNSKNKPIGIEGTLRDITERKKAEEAMKKSEEKYRNITEKFLKVSNEILIEINKKD